MPVIVKTLPSAFSESDREGLRRIYADSPEFSPNTAVPSLEEAVSLGSQLYIGIFNERLVAAILVEGRGEIRQMRYLSVHPATRGRGVAERLVSEVRRLEAERGTHWLEADFDLNQEGVADMLLAMGFIPKGDGHYSYRISG
jgi:ribosomal protein S18 acetylase RimI-like enzyme